MNPFLAAICAVGDTVYDYRYELVRIAAKPIKRGIRHRIRPHPNGRFACQRIAKGIKRKRALTNVDDKERNMPPEWDGPLRGRRVIVYHEADEAGPHVEWYVSDGEQAWNVGVWRLPPEVAEQIKINAKTEKLTASSRKLVLGIFDEKCRGRDYIAQSTDHLLHEAQHEWSGHQNGPNGYGAGDHREVVSDIEIDLWSNGSTVEWVDWELNPHQWIYAHVIYPEAEHRSTPVLIIGYKAFDDPDVMDRLHLRFDQKLERFRANLGEDALVSVKEDGASFYFRINQHGFKAWSPRIAKATGHRIEYTAKLGHVRTVTSEATIKGMGELLFRDTKTGKQLSSTQIGGLLNSDSVVPAHIHPELVLYRVDRVGRRVVVDEDYTVNLERVRALATLHPTFRAPEVISMEEIEGTNKLEGVVGVPAGASLLDGRKFKWRGDERDVMVTGVTFAPGAKGGITGVVYYKDLDHPDKIYKTSSGFTEPMKREMMADPESFVGRVMKIAGFNGHASRAAKFAGWHLDKGAG